MATVHAQAFPIKPIRIVNPAAPGGNSDFFPLAAAGDERSAGPAGGHGLPAGCRRYGWRRSHREERTGRLRHRPRRCELRDLGTIVVPSGVVVHPSLPVSNVKQLIGLAKNRPGQIFYSTSGRGTVGHLAAELLNSMAGIKLVHVAYKGAGPAVIDLVAGHVQMQFASIPLLVGHVQTGRLRMIAQSGASRAAFAKDVPTMEESGLRGFIVRSPFGFAGPAGIPRPIVERLNAALVAAIRDPENSKAADRSRRGTDREQR